MESSKGGISGKQLKLIDLDWIGRSGCCASYKVIYMRKMASRIDLIGAIEDNENQSRIWRKSGVREVFGRNFVV